jgi:hypothetical protein
MVKDICCGTNIIQYVELPTTINVNEIISSTVRGCYTVMGLDMADSAPTITWSGQSYLFCEECIVINQCGAPTLTPTPTPTRTPTSTPTRTPTPTPVPCVINGYAYGPII